MEEYRATVISLSPPKVAVGLLIIKDEQVHGGNGNRRTLTSNGTPEAKTAMQKIRAFAENLNGWQATLFRNMQMTANLSGASTATIGQLNNALVQTPPPEYEVLPTGTDCPTDTETTTLANSEWQIWLGYNIITSALELTQKQQEQLRQIREYLLRKIQAENVPPFDEDFIHILEALASIFGQAGREDLLMNAVSKFSSTAKNRNDIRRMRQRMSQPQD